MNLSLGFVLGSLLLLTPALVLIAALRIYYPIHRTLSFLKQGLVLPAAALVISAVINGPLFLDYANWSVVHVPELWDHPSPATVNLLTGVHQAHVYHPGSWFVTHILGITPASDYNVLALVLDVHLRVLIFSVGLIVFLRVVLWAVQWIDTLWYMRKAGQDDASRFIAERSDRAWFNPIRVVQYIRDAIYHPWALLTSYNPKREVLMVDVLCKGDNLYSGMFTSWTPHGEEAAATVAIQYILRYYPVQDEDGSQASGGPAVAKDGSDPIATASERKQATRRVRFVERNGEMLFPWTEVTTVHFWELRRGTKTIVTIRKEADLEVAKWWLALNEVNPNKLAKVVIDFKEEVEHFRPRLLSWVYERKLLLRNVEQLDSAEDGTPAAPSPPETPAMPVSPSDPSAAEHS